MLIVGEPAPDVDLDALRGEGIITTGYVPDDEFSSYYAAADRIVNLRYPSAGETSGTLIRAFDAGKPVAVSGYAQFAEYPDSCVVKIPFGDDEVGALEKFFTAGLDDRLIARAQRQWLEENATLDLAVDGYAKVIEGQLIDHQVIEDPKSRPFSPAAAGEKVAKPDEGAKPVARITASLPLFAELKLVGLDIEGDDIRITVRNVGDAVVRTRTYGEPEYRIVAKLFAGSREVLDRWLSVPGDLAPGATATLTFPVLGRSGRYSLRLYDGLQSIPSVDSKPWAAAEIAL